MENRKHSPATVCLSSCELLFCVRLKENFISSIFIKECPVECSVNLGIYIKKKKQRKNLLSTSRSFFYLVLSILDLSFAFSIFPKFSHNLFCHFSHYAHPKLLLPNLKSQLFYAYHIKTKTKRGLQFSIWVAVAVQWMNEWVHTFGVEVGNVIAAWEAGRVLDLDSFFGAK